MEKINWFGKPKGTKDTIKKLGSAIVGLAFLSVAVNLFKNLKK